MSIPEAVIKEASCQTRSGVERGPEARARRVILALADDLPESAVEVALVQYHGKYWQGRYQESNNNMRNEMRAAVVAALKDIAGETP